MKKNLLLVIAALVAIAFTFGSCVVERGHGYGGYGGGGYHHHGYYSRW